MNATNSFTLGWNYGRQYGVELTAREIAEEYPTANVDAFAQGNIDGVLNDTFRLNLDR